MKPQKRVANALKFQILSALALLLWFHAFSKANGIRQMHRHNLYGILCVGFTLLYRHLEKKEEYFFFGSAVTKRGRESDKLNNGIQWKRKTAITMIDSETDTTANSFHLRFNFIFSGIIRTRFF